MSYNDEHRYDDIIDLPHHVSTKHPHMAPIDRAAQFSPFAALTGHDEAIRETERLTEERAQLDENSKELLDARLQILREHLSERPEVTFTFFEPDAKKNGGSYVTATGKVKKIDAYEAKIFLDDGTGISIDEIVAIEGTMKGLDSYVYE